MKTQIITLESHDDLVSVRDRMSWAKSPRILLIWPGFEDVAFRPLDLRMLQLHAHTLGADLGLVTRRGEIRREAEAFGIPVFGSTTEAQRRRWPPRATARSQLVRDRTPRRRELVSMRETLRANRAGWTSKPIWRIVTFVLGVFATLSLAALLVPRASVRLTPTSMQQNMSLPVEASLSNPSIVMAGRVPAHEIDVTVSGTQSARVASQAAVPQGKSHGTVRFQNLTESAVVIPAGTIVYSVSPLSTRFATVKEAILEGKLNATVEVPIEALEAGEAGNVPANSIEGIEGLLGTSASVANAEPTTGGSDRLTAVPSEADRQRVHRVLMELLEAEAQSQMTSMIGTRDVLLPNTLHLNQVQKETYDPPAGQPGSLLTLTMAIDYHAEYVKAEDLQYLATANLDASKRDGFEAQPDTLTFTVSTAPRSEESSVTRFDLAVQRTMFHSVDVREVIALVRGISPVAAERVLQTKLALAEPPEIRMSPSWWPWLPLIPFRITVVLP